MNKHYKSSTRVITKHINSQFFKKIICIMSKKISPKFLEGMSYKTKKNKIDTWKIVIAIPKEKQAIIVLLESLEGNAKAEKAVSELTAIDVDNENVMKLLIEKLEKVFESDKIDKACLVYSRFINFHKLDEMSITDYITIITIFLLSLLTLYHCISLLLG